MCNILCVCIKQWFQVLERLDADESVASIANDLSR